MLWNTENNEMSFYILEKINHSSPSKSTVPLPSESISINSFDPRLVKRVEIYIGKARYISEIITFDHRIQIVIAECVV